MALLPVCCLSLQVGASLYNPSVGQHDSAAGLASYLMEQGKYSFVRNH